jgi:hypothetical protein
LMKWIIVSPWKVCGSFMNATMSLSGHLII